MPAISPHGSATDHCLRIDTIREQVVGIDALVPLLDGSMVPYVNLDNAASTPALAPVLDTVNRFIYWYSSVHRGTGFKSALSTQAYDEAHEIVAHFVGADLAHNTVIFVKNTTEAVNKLAARFPFQPGDVVLATFMEHHSNDLPWRKYAQVVYCDITDDGKLDLAHLRVLLEQYHGRVKMVAVSGASNVTGFIQPIHEIAQLAHQYGAKCMVDAAQLAPHRAIDMRPNDAPDHIDYLVLSAHKMYAPFGVGALIGPHETFLQGDPDQPGGGTVAVVTHERVVWAGLPDKEEAGSPNVVGGVALAAAIRALEEIGMDAVAAHEAELTRYALERFRTIPNVTLVGSTDPSRTDDRVGVVSFYVPDLHHGQVAAALSYEHGIGVRDGCFCAHPYLVRLMKVSYEEFEKFRVQIEDQGDWYNVPGLIRISFGVYTNRQDLDTFFAALERVVRHEWSGHYEYDPKTNQFHPQGVDARAFDSCFHL